MLQLRKLNFPKKSPPITVSSLVTEVGKKKRKKRNLRFRSRQINEAQLLKDKLCVIYDVPILYDVQYVYLHEMLNVLLL